MKIVCRQDNCTGCMACIDTCPMSAIKIEDSIRAYNAVIDSEKCIECGACRKVCHCNNPIKAEVPIKWHQAWAGNTSVRKHGSSGGIATALMKAFLSEGGNICGCVFENGEFVFKIIETEDKLYSFSGSKYVKSNPKGIYKKIKRELINGKQILFIGLPCQVASLKLYVGNNLLTRLWTVDLICHGSPSPKVLEYFLEQNGYKISDIEDIRFREKIGYKVQNNNYFRLAPKNEMDKYLISFLNSACYTENCYSCSYAKLERVADITIGDSWGSDQSINEIGKGVSLVLCQSQKGIDLLKKAEIVLVSVDIEHAVKRNKQLNAPSGKPQNRDKLIEGIQKGKNFSHLMWCLFPKQCIKQKIKKYMVTAHFLKRGIEYCVSISLKR